MKYHNKYFNIFKKVAMCCITVNILIFYIKKKYFRALSKVEGTKILAQHRKISNTCEMSVSCKIQKYYENSTQ